MRDMEMITSIDARNELPLLKINSLPLKMVVSNRNLLFQGVYFQVQAVSFREGKFPFGRSNVEGM